MSVNCDITFLQDLRNKIDTSNYEPARRTELLSYVDDFMRYVNALGNTSNTRTLSGTAQEVQERLTQQLALSQAAYLSPHLTKNFGHYLAYLFDIKRSVFGLADRNTQPGAVRELIQQFQKSGFGEVRELIANLQLQDLAIKADVTFRQAQRKYNIPQKPFELFKMQMAEIPFHPYAQDTFNLYSPPSVEFLRARQQRVLDFADQFNIAKADMNAMAEAAQRVTDQYAEIRQVIDVFNIKMGDADVENVQRYVPRQFSQEAIGRIYRQKKDEVHGVFRNMLNDQPKTVREMFVQSRTTNHFIPEDIPLVDFVLTEADPEIYTKLGVDSIDDVIADNGTFIKAFTDVFDKDDKTSQLFDQMVDSGLIAKIPMSSPELYDYVMTRYHLPFTTPKEMFNVSFETQVQVYRRQLEELAGRAMAAQFVARSAIDGEWGVSRAVANTDPAYKDFRPLVGITRDSGGEIDARVGAIPADFALRFGMIGPAYENVFLHPIVADNISAMLEIGTSPNKLGIIARSLATMNSIIKSTWLATSGFVNRQFLNNIYQVTASGGALNIYAQDTVRVIGKVSELGFNKRSIDNLAELFDDTRKIYGGMTERQLWRRLRKDGFIEEIMPLASANFNQINYQPDFSIGRAIDNQYRYSADIWSRVNSVSSVVEAMQQQAGQTSRAAANVSSRFFYRFQQMGSLFDQVARLSAMKSLMASPFSRNGTPTMSVSQRLRAAYEGPVSRGALGNFQRAKTYEEALTHAQKYFFNYSDLGEADKFLNRYVVPFWSFTSRNTFSVFKKLVREPHTFVAYQRIYAALQEPVAEQGEDWPDAGEPDWLADTQPLRYVTEDGDYFAIPMTPIDPLSEGLNQIANIGDAFLNAAGFDFGAQSPEEELQRLLARRSNRGFENLVSNTYPFWKTIYAAVAQANPDTHRAFKESIGDDTSFMGFRSSPFWRFFFQTNIPILNRINNQNPFGVFGRPPRFNNQGELIEQGTPAWLTGVPRDTSDVVRDYQNWRLRVASYMGVTIIPVDVAFTMGYNETGLSIAMNEAKKTINKQRAYIRTLPADTAAQQTFIEEQNAELAKMQQTYLMLRMDLADVTEWARERGLPLNRAVRQIKQQQLEFQQIQSLSDNGRIDIIQDIYGTDFLGEDNER